MRPEGGGKEKEMLITGYLKQAKEKLNSIRKQKILKLEKN
jgi:hypothetical protein